jgi:streptogramin lyase
VLCALVLGLGLGPSAGAAPVGQITEFTLPTGSAEPEAIVAGPDGNLWFTEFAGDKVGEINAITHTITEFAIPTANSDPVDIASGPNGSLWFTESLADKIGEINPVTHAITEIPVPTAGAQPFGIGDGPDGNIWFTEKTANKIGLLNVSTDAVTEFAVPTSSSAPNGIATGPGGSLWFTEASAGKVGFIDPTTHMTTEVPLTAGTTPTVIAPGPDGNMWFTEGGNPGDIAFIDPITRDVSSPFATPTSDSDPIGIATGSDGDLWFTEAGADRVGEIGAGAPAASTSPPAISGTAQAGGTLACQAGGWSSWAGQSPSATEFGFDGFAWLLDGSPIAGATAATFAVPGADAGHQLACRQTVTYPLVGTTVPATSAAVVVSPALGGSLQHTASAGDAVSLTIACQGAPDQSCDGTATLTSRVTTQGSRIVAVTAKARPKRRVTRTERVARRAYSIRAGKTEILVVTLNATGRALLNRSYRLATKLAMSGTVSVSKPVTLSYGRLHISPSATWSFGPRFTTAARLTLRRLPAHARVTVICHLGGCPFARRTFTAAHGTLALAGALAHARLRPGSTLGLEITAPDDIGEVVVFTVRSGRSPAEAFRCLPPGAHAPSACA